MKRPIASPLIVAALALLTTPALADTLYVSPSGDDANPGTEDRPFATLQRARDEIRRIKASRASARRRNHRRAARRHVRTVAASGTDGTGQRDRERSDRLSGVRRRNRQDRRRTRGDRLETGYRSRRARSASTDRHETRSGRPTSRPSASPIFRASTAPAPTSPTRAWKCSFRTSR